MAVCDVCGNDYDKSFEVSRLGETFTFDSIECAAVLLSPLCRHCNCRILGHGLETSGHFYCCAHCARSDGQAGVQDRADQEERLTA